MFKVEIVGRYDGRLGSIALDKHRLNESYAVVTAPIEHALIHEGWLFEWSYIFTGLANNEVTNILLKGVTFEIGFVISALTHKDNIELTIFKDVPTPSDWGTEIVGHNMHWFSPALGEEVRDPTTKVYRAPTLDGNGTQVHGIRYYADKQMGALSPITGQRIMHQNQNALIQVKSLANSNEFSIGITGSELAVHITDD